MKKLKLLLVLFLSLLVVGCTSSSGKFESVTLEEVKTMIENKESFVLEQYGTSCSHCASLKPKLQKFIKEYGLTVKTLDLDKLSEKERAEWKTYVDTLATPTIFFFKDGEEKSVATRIVGDVSYEKIVNKFKDNGIIE